MSNFMKILEAELAGLIILPPNEERISRINEDVKNLKQYTIEDLEAIPELAKRIRSAGSVIRFHMLILPKHMKMAVLIRRNHIYLRYILGIIGNSPVQRYDVLIEPC